MNDAEPQGELYWCPADASGVILKGMSETTAKLDAFLETSAKVDFSCVGASTLNLVEAKLLKSDTKATALSCLAGVELFQAKYVRQLQKASSLLDQSQQRWLTKGISDWAKHVDGIAATTGRSDQGFDLYTFLYRRQMEGIQRRARWAGGKRRGTARAWFIALGKDLLNRIGEGLQAGRLSRWLIPRAEKPSGSLVPIGQRQIFETTLPKIVDQLADVIAPNAPSRSLGSFVIHGGCAN
jgi:hypothetical protein